MFMRYMALAFTKFVSVGRWTVRYVSGALRVKRKRPGGIVLRMTWKV